VVGKISVGINHTVESQPMPKAPVATRRINVPMMPGMMMGMSRVLEFATKPPNTASRAKHEARIIEP
jgi:hypothetical protein